MLGMSVVAAMILSALVAPVDSPATSVPTEKITLDIKTINGSGCPAGTATASADVASDNTAFTVHYTNFTAKAGGGVSALEARKNCQINVLVHVPQGFTYAIASAEYRGYAHIESGASALEQANYYFAGTSPTARERHTFPGPFHGVWRAVDTTDVAELVFAPCGESRNLNINAELRADAGTSSGGSFIEMDSEHASVDTLYHFSWKTC
ncbi:DUF4360 domain-containing protein [Amycolatopsis balhimycina DSM 5908]|uniref:DUF4360 domain-containing protein n=1 Tax=Amycolatopsis balhimycina DSM 5908 TaxID=1081091 RepID=A0A428WDR7_AMYBA|nr:DUF4360 domain-containing protein [Amycolatopsis balhimycina]RSM41235.1 DUF4360 domain-containing protein [Amycolatopsis balhimycina DSM 5908]